METQTLLGIIITLMIFSISILCWVNSYLQSIKELVKESNRLKELDLASKGINCDYGKPED